MWPWKKPNDHMIDMIVFSRAIKSLVNAKNWCTNECDVTSTVRDVATTDHSKSRWQRIKDWCLNGSCFTGR